MTETTPPADVARSSKKPAATPPPYANSIPRKAHAETRTMAKTTAIHPYGERNILWCCMAPSDHSLEDVLNPQYLMRRSDQMQPHHEFLITHELHAFLVRGYILGVDKIAQGLIYKLLPGYPVDLTGIDAVAADYSGSVILRRGSLGYVIQRGAYMLKSGFQNEGEAAAWLLQKQKAIQAITGKD